MTDDSFKRPFPALTPAQRYHLDVYGYVVVENALSEGETSRLLEAMQRNTRTAHRPASPLAPEALEGTIWDFTRYVAGQLAGARP